MTKDLSVFSPFTVQMQFIWL